MASQERAVTEQMIIQHAGLAALMQRPLIETIFRRRTHRVSRGSSLAAGSMSYTSAEPRTPLTELEEAVLISLTGCTGLTMPDRPFADPRNGMPIMAKPNLTMAGRTAGSPDNAQGTSFSSSTTPAPTFCASCRRRTMGLAPRRRPACRPGATG
jgi:hypothetical protein